MTSEKFDELRRRAKLKLLQMHFRSGVGHIGGNLSCIDLLLYLHHCVMQPHDQFILSKGHAAGALYTVLWTLGRISEDELLSFHQDGTRLSGHPPASGFDDILFATGSLGHGLGLGAGLALAKRFKQEPGRVYCLTSDGEWDEGSNWESLIFTCHQRLENLTLIVDVNGLQGFGSTREVADLAPLAQKFREFGMNAQEIDGHDAEDMRKALLSTRPGPDAVVAATHKGCGVSFMEDRMEWHYLPLTEALYSQAVEEIERTCAMSFASRS